MGDFTTAEIRIGGNVPANLIQGDNDDILYLCDMICGEVLSLGWEGEPFEPGTEQELLKALNAAGMLVLRDCEARNGQFDELEAWLVENNIAFDRECASCGEYDAELVKFRPGMSNSETFTCNADIMPTVPATDVRDLIEVLIAASEEASEIHSAGDTKSSDCIEQAYLRLQGDMLKNINTFVDKHLDSIREMEPFSIKESTDA